MNNRKKESRTKRAQHPSRSATGEKIVDAPPKPDLWDQHIRLQADFENYRKRMAKERQEVYQRAVESLLEELLPVLDHFELGLETAGHQEGRGALVDGFRLIQRQLLTTLERFGLTPFEAAGTSFDPHCHEAVSHLPSPEVPENMVLAQTRRGYRLGDRLLRAAQVVVSSGPPEIPAQEHVHEREGDADGETSGGVDDHACS